LVIFCTNFSDFLSWGSLVQTDFLLASMMKQQRFGLVSVAAAEAPMAAPPALAFSVLSPKRKKTM
jgi:hypothetical protein